MSAPDFLLENPPGLEPAACNQSSQNTRQPSVLLGRQAVAFAALPRPAKPGGKTGWGPGHSACCLVAAFHERAVVPPSATSGRQLVWVRWKMEGESTEGHVTPSWSPKGILLLPRGGGLKQLPQDFELNRSIAVRSLYTPLRKAIAILLFKLHYIIHSNVKSCECWN